MATKNTVGAAPHDAALSSGPVQRLHVGKRLSEVAIHHGTVYLAGQIADNAVPDITAQMREVLGHIDRLLTEAGSDKSLILSCQIYLADISDFAAMNAVWDAWVAVDNSPPRATVQATLGRPELLVEIIVVAAQK